MKKLAICCALAAAFVAVPASAQSYLGFGVGSSKISGVDGSYGAGTTVSGGNANRGSVKIYGGFQITPTWGAEAQYSDLGSRDVSINSSGVVTRDSIRASQFSLAGTGTLPLSQSFALIGKVGVSQNRIKGGINENKSDLLLGVGVSYSINPKLAVRAEYEDFGKFSKNGGSGGGSVRANNYSVSLQYAF